MAAAGLQRLLGKRSYKEPEEDGSPEGLVFWALRASLTLHRSVSLCPSPDPVSSPIYTLI